MLKLERLLRATFFALTVAALAGALLTAVALPVLLLVFGDGDMARLVETLKFLCFYAAAALVLWMVLARSLGLGGAPPEGGFETFLRFVWLAAGLAIVAGIARVAASGSGIGHRDTPVDTTRAYIDAAAVVILAALVGWLRAPPPHPES